MEVVVLEGLEVGRGMRGGEELLTERRMGIHRAAHIHQEQDAEPVAAGRPHHNLNLAAVAGALVDGLLEVEFVGLIVAAQSPQSAQRRPHLPGVEDNVAAQVAVAPIAGHLDRRPASAAATNADALRVAAAVAEG